MELPQRKPNRLPDYDYSSPGAYFVTLCIQDNKCILWDRVGASIARPQTPRLSSYGKVIDTAIRQIPMRYPALTVDKYVIMPNHIHMLLQIHADEHGRAMLAPTISVVVQQFKGFVTKQLGHSIWQKLFHDHIIRNERDYLRIWEYIENNPIRWEIDCFYRE